MKFFHTLRSSIYDPIFYAGVDARSVPRTVWYFIRLAMLLAILSSIVFIQPIWSFFSKATLDSLVAAYPAELVVTVTNGKASINQPEPYLIPGPTGESPKNLVVIDTKSSFTISQLADYDTHVLLKENALVMKDDGSQRITSLTGITGVSLSRPLLETLATNSAPYLPFLAIAVILALWLLFTSGITLSLVYFIVLALLTWIIARLMKRNGGYTRAYKMTAYAATAPLILASALSLFNIALPMFSVSLLTLLIVVLNLQGTTQKTAQTL